MVDAVQAATLELLFQRGYQGFEIPEVARSAGVHPTTVYRRWPTKPELVAETMLAHMERQIPMPDTGALRSDLEELLREVAAVLTRHPILEVLRAQVAIGDTIESVTEARRKFWTTRFQQSGAIVERAIARGELPDDTDPHELNEFAVAPIYLRVLVTGDPVDDALLRNSVQRTLQAFGATGSRPHASGAQPFRKPR